MPTSSRVLVIGHPSPSELQFGPLCVNSIADARNVLATTKPALAVFGAQPGLEEFCAHMQSIYPDTKWILCTEQLQPRQLIKWINSECVASTIPNFNAKNLEQVIHSALETIDQRRQQEQLLKLFREQSRNLQFLGSQLEQRVQKRQKQLTKSQKHLAETNSQLEVVHRTLLAIYRAKSVAELERSINEALNQSLQLEWTRILFLQQSSINQVPAENVLSIDVALLDRAIPAKFVLAKKSGQRFSQTETDLLFEISEAIGLALQRMQKLTQAETLKQQWEATFDAISHPLCLTTNQFKILRMNRAFALKVKKKYKDLLGKNCFEVVLPALPLEQPQFPFKITEANFEIAGQALQFDLDEEKAHLILFRDITEEHRLERRILESTKLAELGTIGSSIAHELNNPLGGMLSFLQLIKMDIAKDSPIRADIEAMEKSTLNCRDIIHNLLSFARKTDVDDYQLTDLKSVVERSIKLIELQSKSKGINIITHLPIGELPLKGSLNSLSQALCNLLQNSIDAISEKLESEPLFEGRIELKVELHTNEYTLQICDNGTGIRAEHQTRIFNPLFTTRDPGLFSGMGLTTAFSIISEHAGRLEITSQSGSGTTATISLARPDLLSKSQVFDSEI